MPDTELSRLRTQYNELAELAGSLAHEIKNPLSVIRMNMDLLAEDLSEPTTDAERRALNKTGTVRDQCTRLENLLNDFLRFARLRDLTLSPGSVNDQMTRVLDLFEVQARDLGVDVKRYLDQSLPSIRMNPETLHAALLNLVKNALESMPDGGELVAITQVANDLVQLELIDTGVGMDSNTALHMFEAFFSTKSEGSGLGLPTARKIIEAHGGRIQVQSEVGKGTKFILEFPMLARLT